MALHSLSTLPPRRVRDSRYDLLMAIDHLLEGTQLYAKAVQDAEGYGDTAMAKFFSELEKASRLNAEAARNLLERGGLAQRS